MDWCSQQDPKHFCELHVLYQQEWISKSFMFSTPWCKWVDKWQPFYRDVVASTIAQKALWVFFIATMRCDRISWWSSHEFCYVIFLRLPQCIVGVVIGTTSCCEHHMIDLNFQKMHSSNKKQKAEFWETLEINNNKHQNTGNLLKNNLI